MFWESWGWGCRFEIYYFKILFEIFVGVKLKEWVDVERENVNKKR